MTIPPAYATLNSSGMKWYMADKYGDTITTSKYDLSYSINNLEDSTTSTYLDPNTYSVYKTIVSDKINAAINDSYMTYGTSNSTATWGNDTWANAHGLYTWNDNAHFSQGAGPPPIPLTPQERMREMIRKRQAPTIILPGHRDAFTPLRGILRPTSDVREIRARGTLARMIGTKNIQNYIRNGFISATNRGSGRTYQIFPGHGLTSVWENGKHVERLCVVLVGDFPPTDSLIVRYLLALNDEPRLWKLAKKHGPYVDRRPKLILPDMRPLREIYAEMRAAA